MGIRNDMNEQKWLKNCYYKWQKWRLLVGGIISSYFVHDIINLQIWHLRSRHQAAEQRLFSWLCFSQLSFLRVFLVNFLEYFRDFLSLDMWRDDVDASSKNLLHRLKIKTSPSSRPAGCWNCSQTGRISGNFLVIIIVDREIIIKSISPQT